MTRFISVIGGKGGIGKTTLVSNLASALTQLDHNVIIVDGNLTTPNLGLHLGMHLSDKTLHDVLKGKTKIESATYHHPLGFKILPASMNIDNLKGVDVGRLPSAVSKLHGKSDFVLLDSAAGLGREAVSSIQAADEILLLTNPDLPSVADALRTLKVAQEYNKTILGVVVNRKQNKWYELSRQEIEEMTGHPVIAEIPDDRNVRKSLAIKMPVVDYEPNSHASKEFTRLAHRLSGRVYLESQGSNWRIMDRLVGWMSR